MLNFQNSIEPVGILHRLLAYVPLEDIVFRVAYISGGSPGQISEAAWTSNEKTSS